MPDFLASRSSDRHYRVELGENDRATFIFGNGDAGQIPPIGIGNIRAEYRFGANLDGNVGALTITSDKSGLTFVNTIFNPRPASGFALPQGTTEASLELAKVEGPASLRVRDVALGKLKEAGVGASFHFVPLDSAPAGQLLGRCAGTLATTQNTAGRLIRLPLYADLNDENQDYVIERTIEVTKG